MRTELQAIEREVSSVLLGLPIYEPLFQLMCHGVPSVVKAAVHRVIAALGKFKDAALRLLERLMAAAVVAPSQSVLEGYTGQNLLHLSCMCYSTPPATFILFPSHGPLLYKLHFAIMGLTQADTSIPTMCLPLEDTKRNRAGSPCEGLLCCLQACRALTSWRKSMK